MFRHKNYTGIQHGMTKTTPSRRGPTLMLLMGLIVGLTTLTWAWPSASAAARKLASRTLQTVRGAAKTPLAPAAPLANGPACSTFTNRTTANGLGGNTVFGVFAAGNTVYAATNGGLSISTNSGTSFSNRTTGNGLGNNTVNGVYAEGTTVYAATESGLSISTDGGTSFSNRTTGNGLGSNVVKGVFAVGSTVYAATNIGLAISTDGGASFTNKTVTNASLGNNSVSAVYAEGSTVYAGTGGGLSISTDGGTSFTNRTTGNGLGNNAVLGVYAVGPTVYAATFGGLSISTDGGASFTNRTTADGLGFNQTRGVYALGNTVYVATGELFGLGGISISTNGGTSFTNYTTANGLGGDTVLGTYATTTHVYAAALGGLAFCSPPAAPVINIKGNNTTIASGDTTPTTTDGTDFGSAAANTGANAQSFTIENTGTTALNLTGTPKVALAGANASDFSIALQPASPVAAAGSTTFLVNFAPTATGTRTATISIASDDSTKNPYTFTIQGTGTAAPTSGPACNLYTNRTSADGLGADEVNGIFAAGNTIYLAIYGGLAISTNGGVSFSNLDLGPNTSLGVYVVGNNIYVATDGSGLAVSTDGGNTFTFRTTSDGLGTDSTTNVYVAGNTVYVATQAGLSISTDGGNTFVNKTTADGLGSDFVTGVFAVGSRVYAATGNGLSISTDGGNTFTNKTTTNGLGSDVVNKVYAVGNTVYAATQGGLSISTDGGNTFTNKTLSDGLGADQVLSVFALGSTVYAATEDFNAGGLSISMNGGASFTNYTTSNGLGSNTVFSVFATSTAVYAGTTGGLSYCPPPPPALAVKGNNTTIANGDTTPSTTDGTDFGSAAANIGANANYFVLHNTGAGPLTLTGTPKVAISGANAADFSIALQPASLVPAYGTAALLVNFAPTATGTRTATISIASNDTNNSTYTFQVQGTGTAAPANGSSCSNFVNRTTANGLGANDVTGIFAAGGTLYVATYNGLAISTNGGSSFTNKTTANGLASNVLTGVYVVGNTIYAATDGGGLSISPDGGNTFVNKTTADGLGDDSLRDVYVAGNTVYVATENGLSISTDGGNTFTNKMTADGLGSDFVTGVFAVGSRVYVATQSGVSVSTDGGNTFTTTTSGLGNLIVNRVYAVGNTVYAATQGGLAISTDGGNTFINKTLSDGLGANRVLSVFAQGSTVYAATVGTNAGGLSISTNGGATFTNYTTTNGLGSNLVFSVFATSTGVYAGTNSGLSYCPPPCTAPMVTTQPQSDTVEVGYGVQFNAAASGSPAPTVQWQVSTDGGANFTNLANEVSSTLVIGAATIALNGNQYRAVFTNTCGNVNSNPATLTVTCAPISLEPSSPTLTPGTAGEFYTAQFTAAYSGTSAAPRQLAQAQPSKLAQVNTPVFNFAVTNGALPAGLTLGSDGYLSGTPTSAGTYTFTVTATDNGQVRAPDVRQGPVRSGLMDASPVRTCSTFRQYTLVISCPTITITPATLPTTVVNKSYSQNITASVQVNNNLQAVNTPLRRQVAPTAATAASFTYEVTGGTLPNGVMLGTNGLLSGTPTQSGDFTFTVTATATFSGGNGLLPQSLATALMPTATSLMMPPPPVTGCTQTKQYTLTVRPCLTTITVNAVGDATDVNPGDAICETAAGNGICTLRAAVAEANALPACAPTTIRFASPLFDTAQTITLSGTDLTITHPNLTINGTGASKLTVSGNNASRVFTINSSGAVTISGLTVTGGNGVSSLASNNGDGGGILLKLGNLTLQNAIVSANTATSTASADGGGITNRGNGSSALTLTNCFITGNDTNASGGGIFNLGGPLIISNSTISNNRAGLQSNSTGLGGGIENYYPMTLTNSTISGNSVANTFGSHGGGVYTPTGTGNMTPVQIISCTITGNTAAGPNSAGGLRLDYDDGGPLMVSNTIIAGNTGNSGATADVNNTDSGVAFTSGGYNLIGDGTGGSGFSGMADQVGTVGSPLLVGLGPLTDNGGTTRTHALLPGSPALDKGKSFGLMTDQRGLARPYNLTSVTDANGGDGSDIGAYELQCAPITLSPASLPGGQVGLPYVNPLSATGGTAPYSFRLTSGSLPVGLTLNGNGSWSGVAGASGPYNFTVTVTDASGCTGSQSYAVTFACPPLSFTPLTLAGGTVGAAYSQGLAVSNAFGNAAAFTLLSGALPPGVSLTSAGLLAGTPTQPGPYSFTVKATDTLGCSGTQVYNLTVACNTLVFGTTSLAGAVKGVAYSQTLAVTNGRGAVSYALANGSALPQGLTLAPNGVISGTPTAAAATTSFSVVATDANGCTGTSTLTLSVACPPVTLAALPSATAGSNYSAQLQASPAGGSYAYSSANLPSGLTLAANGTLSGTLATAGSFSFNVTVTGWGNCTATVAVTLTVGCPTVTVPGTLAGGVQGQVYTASVAASPAGGNYSYAVTTNTLPPGLSLSSTTGALTGTPTAAGNYTFNVTTTGWGACSKVQTYNLTISSTCNLLTVNPSTLPGGTVGTAYSQTLSATGGVAPYSFAVTAGTLPSGLTLSSAGALGGTPSAVGTFNFTVTATSTGQGGCTGTRSYTVVVACPTLSITPNTLPNATAGVAYNQTVTASPAGSYNYTLATGNLPPGLSLNATSGAITGTASAPGTYSFSVKADRGAGCNATKSYTIVVTCPTITLNPPTLPGGNVGAAYSQSFSATPATGTYSYAVAGGNLPPGLTLTTAGSLSGTPTTTGSYTFTVRVTGFSSASCNATRSYTVVIGASCAAITLPSLPGTGAQGAAYYGDLSATTPSGAYTFSLESGTLPPGLGLDNLFGALLGTATQAGSYSFTVKATSATGCTGTRTYTVVINGGAALALFADYDGDRQADPVLWRAASGAWDILLSQQPQGTSTRWGAAGDVTLLGDYDGDGKTDLAVFRPSNGTWYIQRSRDGVAVVKAWGLGTDVPVPGDYDGDGKTDLAVWRGTTGTWYILRSTDGEAEVQLWGSSSAPYYDVPVTGDYDGDGRTDLGVFRRGTGTWLLKRSSDAQARLKQWGVGSDMPVAGDYDGDGQTDVAVWRGTTGQWFVLQSSDQSYRVTEWGAAGAQDQPVPGDYDGDGQADYAVWRSTSAEWRVRLSGGAAPRTQAQGQRGDQPVTARQP